tara:strand:+ start:1024 stop:1515 length:492 start_codon:yes stop_codon:yes gene_type:complete
MIIKVKNKDSLIIGEFRLKCSVGKNGFKKRKVEGDYYTPSGKFEIGKLYWRPDRVNKPETSLYCKQIKKNSGWCTDSKSKLYNKEFTINKKFKHEKLYRKDDKYNYFILIKYNYKKTIKGSGSAIFIHLTKNYKPTAGCIALSKKDFLILAKLVNNKTKIIIN